jgi:hypothetical protein
MIVSTTNGSQRLDALCVSDVEHAEVRYQGKRRQEDRDTVSRCSEQVLLILIFAFVPPSILSATELNRIQRKHMASTDPNPPPPSPPSTRPQISTPKPAYLPTAGSPLTVDQVLYSRIQAAPRERVQEFVLPIRSGRAWSVKAGQIVRISTPEGAQVGRSLFFSLSRHVYSWVAPRHEPP